MNFKELKKLGLNNNKLSDIKVLEKVKFEKLEILHLGENKISDIKYSSIINNLNSKIKVFDI